jgi:DNA primase
MNPILQHVDVKTIIAMLGLKLKCHGHYWQGCCPLHNSDSDTSFSIHEDGYYTCFSHCGSGSINNLVFHLTGKNIYRFLDIKDVDSFIFKSILKKEDKRRDSFEVKNIEVKGNLFDVIGNQEVLDYLEKKRVPLDFVDFFRVKYALNAEINTTPYRNRLVIPIYEDGKIISYEGKDFTGKDSKKVIYNKGSNVSTLFNIDNLDRDKPLIVCEGILKIAEIWTYITPNVTATFGAQISNKQKELLNEFKEIIVFADNDSAGLSMISQFDEFYNKEFWIAIPIEEGKDPGDLTVEEKEECFKNKKRSVEYFLDKSQLFDEEKINW